MMEAFDSQDLLTTFHFLTSLVTSQDLAIRITRKILYYFFLTFISILASYQSYCQFMDKENAFVLFLISTFPIIFLFGKLYTFYSNHWKAHMIPQPIKSMESEVFMDEHIAVKYNAKYDKLHFTPSKFNQSISETQGYALYGSSRFDFLWITLTMGFEYFFCALQRIFKMYGNVGKYANKHTTRKDFYLAMINSSMACWMNSQTGHLEFRDMKLMSDEANENGSKVPFVPYCRIELDHEKQEFVKMIIELDDGLGLREVKDETSDTCDEAAVIALIIVTVYTHSHIHFWANGVAQLIQPEDPKMKWDLAKESNDVTQWINLAAVFGSGTFCGKSEKEIQEILSHNVLHGLPMHNDKGPSYMRKAAKFSKSHKMHMEAMAKIQRLYPEWPRGVLQSVAAATIFHSADHYYIDKYLKYATQSKYLQYDFSFARAGVIALNVYHTRHIRCCERLDDPICKIVYETAMKHDPEFAQVVNFACAT